MESPQMSLDLDLDTIVKVAPQGYTTIPMRDGTNMVVMTEATFHDELQAARDLGHSEGIDQAEARMEGWN